jgi:MFS family permease
MTLEQLERKRNELAQRRSMYQRFYYSGLAAAFVIMAIGLTFAWRFKDSILGPIFAAYVIAGFAMLPMARAHVRSVEEDMQELDFQIDLQQFDVTPSESRAEKILRLNSFQLRRYHDINLQQNTWVFTLGVLCILLGVAVIGVTFYLVIRVAQTLDAKIIIGALGAIGSLLTNYIAAIYLKMHSGATKNLAAFHSKLVDTHQTLFGNLVASRIEDDKLRGDTLAKLALHVAASKAKTPNDPSR